MEIDHRVLGVVPNNSIGATNNELVIKCQLAAICGLEKQMGTLKSKLNDCDEDTSTVFHFYSLSMSVIESIIISLLSVYYSRSPSSKFIVLLSLSLIALVKLKTYGLCMSTIGSIILLLVVRYSGAPSSECYVVLLSLCVVAWVVASVIALVKLKTGRNQVSLIRAQMNYPRDSVLILQALVVEDYRTNEGARCFVSYYSRLSRILGLLNHIIQFHNYQHIRPDMRLHGLRTLVFWICFSILVAEVCFS